MLDLSPLRWESYAGCQRDGFLLLCETQFTSFVVTPPPPPRTHLTIFEYKENGAELMYDFEIIFSIRIRQWRSVSYDPKYRQIHSEGDDTATQYRYLKQTEQSSAKDSFTSEEKQWWIPRYIYQQGHFHIHSAWMRPKCVKCRNMESTNSEYVKLTNHFRE